ncbi:MAG: hypothetical protein Sylvanvirus12_10 [Sylvanvirus sp.]|uniref:Uncharacterized protein n=1 Tax=Sylvanvirus sp. TaxID=2487774 RepID=A0A3G5AI93_9VIRU|nr:MAG: hypothetical protein Sylvanvirus12_10 [Sylvanvirus sp.]
MVSKNNEVKTHPKDEIKNVNNNNNIVKEKVESQYRRCKLLMAELIPRFGPYEGLDLQSFVLWYARLVDHVSNIPHELIQPFIMDEHTQIYQQIHQHWLNVLLFANLGDQVNQFLLLYACASNVGARFYYRWDRHQMILVDHIGQERIRLEAY